MELHITQVLLAVISILLAAIFNDLRCQRKDQREWNDKALDKMSAFVDEKTCCDRRNLCPSCLELENLKSEQIGIKKDLSRHSHTGLPANSVLFQKQK